jgi:thiol-disulfide isomerase/thioredoxin
MTSTTRRWMVMAGAGTAALGAGAGWRWWQEQPGDPDEQAVQALWALTLATPSGAQMPLAPFRGRPLVVNFWATWCPPCVKEMPELDRFAQAFAARDWQVVGIAIDQPGAVQKFLQQTPVRFPIAVTDTAAGLALIRGLGNADGGLPFTLHLRADGTLARRKLGPTTFDELAGWTS